MLLAKSGAAPVGSRSETDFAFCREAVRTGLNAEEAYDLCRDLGKFAQASRRYFDRTWHAAKQKIGAEMAELRRMKEIYPGVFE